MFNHNIGIVRMLLGNNADPNIAKNNGLYLSFILKDGSFNNMKIDITSDRI